MDESKLEKQIALLQAKMDKANKKLDAIEAKIAKIEAIRTDSQKADNSTDNSWREPDTGDGF